MAGENKLSKKFNQLAAYLKHDKGIQPGSILTSIVLATTAVATPILTTALGATAALFGGLYLLSKTSDTVLNNSRAIGSKMGINPMALGIVLGVLTSMPELFVSMGAMISGNPGIGIGNIVGSNIANILLILGGTAAVKKINIKGVDWKFNAMAMGAATLLFGAQMVMGFLSPVVGTLLIAGAAAYIWKSVKDVKKQAQKTAAEAAASPPSTDSQPAASVLENNLKPGLSNTTTTASTASNATDTSEDKENKLPKWANLALGGAGLLGLLGAASFVVSSAVALGAALNISAAVVGLLAVAVGTSLPEIMVSLKAAKKGDSALAVGNILGSNFFNFAIIGGILSMTGAPMPDDFSVKAGLQGVFNAAAVAGSAALAIGALKSRKESISRLRGVAGLCLYAAFTVATFLMGKKDVPEKTTPEPVRQEVISEPSALHKMDNVPFPGSNKNTAQMKQFTILASRKDPMIVAHSKECTPSRRFQRKLKLS